MGSDAYEATATPLAKRGALANCELQAASGLDGAAARTLLKELVAAGLAPLGGERRGTRCVRV